MTRDIDALLDDLRRKGQYLPDKPPGSDKPFYRGMMGNPPNTTILRAIEGRIFCEEAIAWEFWSEGPPVPILLGVVPLREDFAVWHQERLAGGGSAGQVKHRGRYFESPLHWLEWLGTATETR